VHNGCLLLASNMLSCWACISSRHALRALRVHSRVKTFAVICWVLCSSPPLLCVSAWHAGKWICARLRSYALLPDFDFCSQAVVDYVATWVRWLRRVTFPLLDSLPVDSVPLVHGLTLTGLRCVLRCCLSACYAC